MAVFSTNQNRQLYVATSVGTVTEDSEKGTIEVKKIENGLDQSIIFKYKGADTTLKSDYIPVKSIIYAKATSADDLADKLKQVTVTLDGDVNGGEPISGQDYVLRIAFRQYYGMSDEDQYFKFGAVHATASMTAETFYEKMKESLEKNFSKEIGKTLTFESSESGLVIKEVEQPWHLGLYSQEQVCFDVYPGTVYSDGDEVVWGKTEKADSGETVKDGHKIADLEYFCMGERGDQYRMKGWPRVIPTTYLVDPDKEYSVLDIHYNFVDTGVNSYKSEKDVTIVAESADVINEIVSAVNEAAGIEIESISGSSDTDSTDSTDSTEEGA